MPAVNVIRLIGISCGACARAKAAVGYAERPRFGVSLCEDQNAFLDVLIPCAYCVSTNVVGEGGRRLSNRSSRIGLGESRRPRLGSCPFQIPKRRIPAPHINFTVLARPCCSTLTSPHLTTPHHTSSAISAPSLTMAISPQMYVVRGATFARRLLTIRPAPTWSSSCMSRRTRASSRLESDCC